MFCNRGIYHEGWTAVTRHRTPWVIGRALPRVRRRRVGALRHEHRLDPGARPRRGDAREARRAAAACSSIEARKYNVLPLDDRRVERFNSDLAGRPALDQGQLAAALRRHGPAHRELGAQHQEQVALGHRRGRRSRDGGAERRDRRPGRRVRRLEPLRQGRQAEVLPTTCSASQRFNVEGDAPIPPGTHQVRMEFAYDGGGLGKGGDRHALRRRRRRSARAASRPPSR